MTLTDRNAHGDGHRRGPDVTADESSDNSAEESKIDKPRIERAVREILLAIGEDLGRDGLLDTPRRVARMYEEIFSGIHEDPGEHLSVLFEADHDEMVMVKD